MTPGSPDPDHMAAFLFSGEERRRRAMPANARA
jgi:hypothetical protein